MKLFLFCWGKLVLYTLGILVACGLAVEICYRLYLLLMGRRKGRTFWFVTSYLGTPIHEIGHALMCLLFAHRIEKVRLVPTKAGDAMVEHSYNKRNLYAVSGNLWIGLGPLFSGLAVILAVLCLVYPASMQTYHENIELLLSRDVEMRDMLSSLWQLACGLFVEQTQSVWVRSWAIVLLFSTALHVRLSAQDIVSMISGLPGFGLITAIVALIATYIGDVALSRLAVWLKQLALWLISLFALILLFCLLLLLLALVYWLLHMFFQMFFTKKEREK